MKLYTIFYYYQRFALESTMIWAGSEEEALEKFKSAYIHQPQYIKVGNKMKEIGTVRI